MVGVLLLSRIELPDRDPTAGNINTHDAVPDRIGHA